MVRLLRLAIVLAIVVGLAPAADADPDARRTPLRAHVGAAPVGTPRPAASRELHMRAELPRTGADAARRAITPTVTARLFALTGGLARLAGSVVALPIDWTLPATTKRWKWRPKLMLHPMSFPTGGGGVKLKYRF